MSKQTIFYSLIILIVIASIIYLYKFTGDPLSQIPNTPIEIEDSEDSKTETTSDSEGRMMINFEEEGNIVSGNPGQESGRVYLVYEKPGSSALQAELSFNMESTCIFDGSSVECAALSAPLPTILTGRRVKIAGFEESGVINVATLESLDASR